MNLMEGLQKELARNREILEMYKEIPTGVFGATTIQTAIDTAENAIANNNITAMVTSLAELQETE